MKLHSLKYQDIISFHEMQNSHFMKGNKMRNEGLKQNGKKGKENIMK